MRDKAQLFPMDRILLGSRCRLVKIAAIALSLFASAVARADDSCSIDYSKAIGLTVNVEDSQNCGGSNPNRQVVSKSAKLSGGQQQPDEKGCPYVLAVTVEGSVELQDNGYDYVYVNDVLYFSSRGDGAGCAMLSNTETRNITVYPGDSITLTYDTVDGLYHTGGHATITNIALVQGGCSNDNGGGGDCSTCAPGDGGTNNNSVDVAIGMGSTSQGKTAGMLRLKSATPSADLAKPSSLQYGIGLDVDATVVRQQNVIRQVKTSICLADIVSINNFKYEVRFYNASQVGNQDANHIYSVSGSPYVVWTVENPDASATTFNSLNITQTRGSQVKLSSYVWNSSLNGWELTKAGRKETRSNTQNGNDRTSTYTIANLSGVIAYKKLQKFHTFAWGEELIEETIDPDGAALKTTWSFDENAADGGYGLLQQVVQPTGQWKVYSYDEDGRLTKTVSQFLNSALGSADAQNRVVTKTYSDYVPQETEVTTLLGQEIARHYHADYGYGSGTDEIQCQTAGAAFGAADNLVTRTLYYSDGDFKDKPSAVYYPDGTLQVFQYSSDGQNIATTCWQGQADGSQTTVVDGLRTETIVNAAGQTVSELVYDIASNLLLTSRTASSQDAFGRPLRYDFEDGSFETFSYDCCGMDSHTDRNGVTTTYAYDDFKRVQRESLGGVSTIYGYDAAGNRNLIKREGTDGTQTTTESSAYDVAGRQISRTDALGKTTVFSENLNAQGQTIKTTTLPDNLGVSVETYAQDGALLSVGGSAAHPLSYAYGADANGAWQQEIHLGSQGETTEWTKTYTDPAGRSYKIVHANGGIERSTFNNQGQLSQLTDADGVAILYAYSAKGELRDTAVDMDHNGTIDYGGTDRVTRVQKSVVSDHGGVTVLRAVTSVWAATGTDSAQVVATSDATPSGRQAWQTTYGLTAHSSTVCDGAGTCTTTTTAPDGSYTVNVTVNNRQTSQARYDSANHQLSSTSYFYDAQGRQNKQTDARTGDTLLTYYDNDLLHTTAHASLTTAYIYDALGRETEEDLPEGGQINSLYWPTGELKSTGGERTYSQAYTYDTQGRLLTQTTTGAAGNAVTTWNYDSQSGELASKVYADGHGPSYTQTLAGRMLTRHWARGIVATYSYNNAGELQGVTYSDGTPAVSYTYNRLGQMSSATGGSGVTDVLSYQGAAPLLASDSMTSGPTTGYSTQTGYDTLLHRSSLSVRQGTGTAFVSQNFGFDAAGRLQTISQGSTSVSYGYLPSSASNLVQTVTFANGGNVAMTTTKSYNGQLDRLESIVSQVGGNTVSGFVYSYNTAQQRTSAALSDGTHWSYGYDNLGHVTSGNRRHADNSAVAGQQFGYVFDAIGNRTSATVNGRTASYTPNVLNQYVRRDVPGAVDVIGMADPSAAVTVNNQTVNREASGYFYKGLNVSNTNSPVGQSVDVLAFKGGAGTSGADVISETQGNVFVPQSPEQFSYDLDGNLVQDGHWTYTWDAENRLLSATSLNSVPVAIKTKLGFVYDWMGRRIQKQVFNWNAGTNSFYATPNSATSFIYDGWNLVAELDGINANAVSRTYLWGQDLSGTLQNGGGVGGLLVLTEYSGGSGAQTNYACYDGNGNIASLVNSSAGNSLSQFEYGPFGELLRMPNSAQKNDYVGFATKVSDVETNLCCFGRRYYNPSTGRWLSRDPMEEEGGSNLYGYSQNDGINAFDPLGLDFIDNNNFTLVDSIPGQYGFTKTSISLQLACKSTGKSCQIVIKKFDIKIVEIDIATHAIHAGRPTPRRPQAIDATKTHERMHVQHYHDFYDMVAKRFPMDCGGKGCEPLRTDTEKAINKEFDDKVKTENQHIGAEWQNIQDKEQ